MSDAPSNRERHIERLKRRLRERGQPHAQVFVILCFTGMIGFLTSVVLRELGMAHYMGMRYLVAVLVAYLAFLGMLGLWVVINRARRLSAGPVLATADVSEEVMFGIDVVASSPELPVREAKSTMPTTGSSGGNGLGNIGDVGDGLLFLVILLIVVAVLATIFASVWVLIEAPLLLAELLIDGVLIAGMARRLRERNADQHWAVTAVKRTYIPFLITAASFGFVGFSLQYFVSDATTMLEALKIAAQ